MSIARISVVCSSVLVLAACEQRVDNMATENPAAAPEQELPDWRGWWAVEGGPLGRPADSLRVVLQDLGEFSPEARAIVELGRGAEVNSAGSPYCIPTRFNGATNGGATNDVEFLLMPERLTITNGDNLLRRIPIDGRPLRESPEPSNGGTSVGMWEGDTLIIETIGLHPDTTFPISSRPNLPQIGENVHVLERIRLNEQDQLVVETELTAPDMLVEPINYTTVYFRDVGYVYRDHDVCSLDDRSIDPETGRERFDLTPPPNLPPPPPRAN